jgi:Alanine-zipper, major outer membrane lipoprotein
VDSGEGRTLSGREGALRSTDAMSGGGFMRSKTCSAAVAVLLMTSVLSVGCAKQDKPDAAEAAATRAEAAARRSEAAASRVEAAAQRAEAAADRAERMFERSTRK